MVGELYATGVAFVDPLIEVWNGFVRVLPGIIAAIIILIIGYFIALLLGYVVKKMLVKAGLDSWMRKARLDDSIGHLNLSSLAATITKWYVFIVFLIPASAAITIRADNTLGTLLSKLAMWLPKLIIALILVLFGLIAADYIYDRMMRARMKGIGLASAIVKWIILIFIALIALKQIGVNISLAESTILIIITAIALAFALAIGIGFGFGFKEEAKNIIKDIKKKI